MDPITVLQSRIEQLEAKLGLMPSTLDMNDSQHEGVPSQHVSEQAPASYQVAQTLHKHHAQPLHAQHPHPQPHAPQAYHQPVPQPQHQYHAQMPQQLHNKNPLDVHLQHDNQSHAQHAVSHSVPHQHVPQCLNSSAVPMAPLHQHPIPASNNQHPIPASNHQHNIPATNHQHSIPASPNLPASHCQRSQAQHQYNDKELEKYQYEAPHPLQHGDSVTANLVNVANTINSAVAGHEKLAAAMQQATELNNYMDPNLMENFEKSKMHMNEVIAGEPTLKHHCQCMHRYQQAAPVMESEAISQVPQMQSTLDNMHAGIARVKNEADDVSQGIQQLAESCGAAAMRGSEQLADVARQVEQLEARRRKRNGLDDC